MLAAVEQARGKTAEEILSAVFQSADAFIGGAVQQDDMTLLVMKLELLRRSVTADDVAIARLSAVIDRRYS